MGNTQPGNVLNNRSVILNNRVIRNVVTLKDTDEARTKEATPDLWGNVFTQGSDGDETWSYHFISQEGNGENGVFLSQENSNVKLDNGESFPKRIPFVSHSFDREFLTFRGTIDYRETCNSTAWGGYHSEEVEMVFDTEFTIILSGKLLWRRDEGDDLSQNFGLRHLYINVALTRTVANADDYTTLTSRLKKEGATNRAIGLVARMFLDDPNVAQSARRMAILDIVREHTPNPTPTFNPRGPWGNVFQRQSGVSLHFFQNGAYVSYENRNYSSRKLDDGSPAPSRIPFLRHSYDESKYTFRGSVDFLETYGSTWGGMKACEYEMIFDTKFIVIIGGRVVKKKLSGEESTATYGDKGLNYLNAALTARIPDGDSYTSTMSRLKREGATDETIHSIQRVFLKDNRADYTARFKAILDIVSGDWTELRYLDSVWQDNREIVMAAVSCNGHALYYASDKLKDDEDFITAAVMENGSALNYASENLKDQKEVVLAAISNDGSALKFASSNLKDDREVVMAAVSDYGDSLEFASDNFKNDEDIVKIAVSHYGLALKFAFNGMKNNKGVAMTAINNDVSALEHVSDGLKNDEEIIKAAVKKSGISLQFASKELRRHKDIVMLAVKNDARSIKHALGGLNQDQDCLEATGLWGDNNDDSIARRIIISANFSNEKYSPHATMFSVLLKIHPYFQDFIVHLDKHVHEEESNFERQLQLGKDTNGIMIQVTELDHPSTRNHVLSDNQKVESEMASKVDIKVFKVFQGKSRNKRWAKDFEERHLDAVAKQVKCWYDNGCLDSDDCNINL